jgi:hypothetical protein
MHYQPFPTGDSEETSVIKLGQILAQHPTFLEDAEGVRLQVVQTKGGRYHSLTKPCGAAKNAMVSPARSVVVKDAVSNLCQMCDWPVPVPVAERLGERLRLAKQQATVSQLRTKLDRGDPVSIRAGLDRVQYYIRLDERRLDPWRDRHYVLREMAPDLQVEMDKLQLEVHEIGAQMSSAAKALGLAEAMTREAAANLVDILTEEIEEEEHHELSERWFGSVEEWGAMYHTSRLALWEIWREQLGLYADLNMVQAATRKKMRADWHGDDKIDAILTNWETQLQQFMSGYQDQEDRLVVVDTGYEMPGDRQDWVHAASWVFPAMRSFAQNRALLVVPAVVAAWLNATPVAKRRDVPYHLAREVAQTVFDLGPVSASREVVAAITRGEG